MDQDDLALIARLEDPEIINRKFSHRVGKWFDAIGAVPNFVTGFALVLCLPMSLFFTLANTVTGWRSAASFLGGVVLYICIILSDFVDGALARYQADIYKIDPLSEDEEEKLSYWKLLKIRGKSQFGTVLDPFRDKTLYFGALFPLGWHVVAHWLIWTSFSIAVTLSLIRFRTIRRALEISGKGAANQIGKYKIWFEVAVIAMLAFVPNNESFANTKSTAANIAVGIALAIGCLSLTGHLWIGFKRATLARKAAVARRKDSSSQLRVVK